MKAIPQLDMLFKPVSVAVVGASNNRSKTGHRFLSGLINGYYKGKVYAVNPREAEIEGLVGYPRLVDIPANVDLAIIAIPAPTVPQVVADCVQSGVKYAIVHSAGFAESGNDGRALQEKIVETILTGCTRVIGPNCMGLYCPEAGINTITSIPSTREDIGGVAFVGQSGWVTENVLLLGHERGLRFSKVLSIGNQSDLTIEDLLAYLGNDDDTDIIGLYVEGLKRASEFLPLAKEVSRKKPVVVWKAGRTEEGAKATTSHTGSIAGNALTFDTAIRQSGLIAAKNLEEMIDLLVGFSSPVLPRGDKLGLLVEAGGGAVASADAATALGFKLPILSEEIQHRLKIILENVIPTYGAPRNPVDIVWGPSSARSQFFVQCAQEILKEVDALLLVHYGVYDDDYAQGMSKLRDSVRKPILVVPGHHSRNREGMDLVTRNGIPSFAIPERALSTLAATRQYSNYLQLVT